MSAEPESGDDQPKGREDEAKGWKIPSLKGFGEYIKRLLELEGTVASLKAETSNCANSWTPFHNKSASKAVK